MNQKVTYGVRPIVQIGDVELITVSFTLNGRPVSFAAEPGESAQKFLQRNGVASVRNSDDGFGFAGSDSILLDGRIVGANILVAPQLEGHDVKTVESLREGRQLGLVHRQPHGAR